jgi:hypothetical protein
MLRSQLLKRSQPLPNLSNYGASRLAEACQMADAGARPSLQTWGTLAIVTATTDRPDGHVQDVCPSESLRQGSVWM